jgi:hypothetical protein
MVTVFLVPASVEEAGKTKGIMAIFCPKRNCQKK